MHARHGEMIPFSLFFDSAKRHTGAEISVCQHRKQNGRQQDHNSGGRHHLPLISAVSHVCHHCERKRLCISACEIHGYINSFHEKQKDSTAVAAIPGLHIGSTIKKKARICDAPSSYADSSINCGTSAPPASLSSKRSSLPPGECAPKHQQIQCLELQKGKILIGYAFVQLPEHVLAPQPCRAVMYHLFPGRVSFHTEKFTQNADAFRSIQRRAAAGAIFETDVLNSSPGGNGIPIGCRACRHSN